MKRLIVTGDDFGLALPVNEAIEQAHRSGILTTASLMVGAEAAEDAVMRARRLPFLRVGLHLVLIEGRPVLPPKELSVLVDARGEFFADPFRAGVKFFFRRKARKQLEAEIRAQFQKFQEMGLKLDHVNSHNHMHLHPTVLGLILKVGRDYGLAAVRLPYEPAIRSWRASRKALSGRLAAQVLLTPWTALLRYRLQRAGVSSNKFVFGMFDSGSMKTERVLRILEELPQGVSEIYFHPATRKCPEIQRTMPEYCHVDELAALTSASVKEAFATHGIERIAFSDI